MKENAFPIPVGLKYQVGVHSIVIDDGRGVGRHLLPELLRAV